MNRGEWMTRTKAMNFHGKSERTIQGWVERYGVRKRINRDGYAEYFSEDLEVAEWRSRHRGAYPSWFSNH